MTRRDRDSPATSRWFQRVVPVSAIVAVAAVSVALAWPGFRHQLRLSATRIPEQYAALSFGRAADGTVVVCTGNPTEIHVSFVVDSHFASERSFTYRILAGGNGRSGQVSVGPDRTVETTETLKRPATTPFEVVVSLPEVGQEVHARCSPVPV